MLRWEFAKAVFSEFREHVLHIGAELFGSEASGRTFEPIQPLGLRARPRDPDVDAENYPTAGAGVLVGWEGSEAFAMPTGDPRAENEIPEGQQGSVYLYACTEEKRPSYIGIEGDGSHQHLAQYPDGSAAHAITMEVHEEGSENIQVRHGKGHAVSLLADGTTLVSSPNGKNWIKVSDDGIEISGSFKAAGGSILGDVAAAQPAPTMADINEIKAAVVASLAGITAQGQPVVVGVPFAPATPGSSSVKIPP